MDLRYGYQLGDYGPGVWSAVSIVPQVSCMILCLGGACAGLAQRPEIPRVWQDTALEQLEVPVSQAAYSPKPVSEDYYYRVPVLPIYKSYPVYAPGRAPAGYLETLKGLKPELAFNPARLRTKEDWIRAGETVFDAPATYGTDVSMEDLPNPEWYAATGVRVAKDGTVPWVRYVIRGKGNVEAGNLSCGFCHSRVLPDGSVVKGAQSNFSFDKAIAFRNRRRVSAAEVRSTALSLFTVQWVPAMQRRLEGMSAEEISATHDAIPPGVFARNRSSPFYPPAVPDLIGVRDRRYLDKTGATVHRSLVDLMRYASMAQGIEFLSSFGGFIPSGEENFTKLPPPETQERFSDEQLYALGLYLYSLKPPPNPNRFDQTAEAGRSVFQRQGCAGCHPPPVYTNNKLLPAQGFEVPADHLRKYDILDMPIGTDPRLTLQTRRGTGYYKVPSLRGVWYRGPFEHNGSVATLEDWFDERRLHDEYVPSGFIGYGVNTRAVRGHEFGLKLPAADKQALIAFLRTL
jgi:hypothetical protein